MKALVVGAGIAGLTAAVLLHRKKWDVVVLEARPVVGGNCIDHCVDYQGTGVHVHVFGPHIFHTNDERVWRFVNEFSGFTGYQHRVCAVTEVHPDPLPVPYNQLTADTLGKDLTDEEIRQAFFTTYTEKMWGMPYSSVPAAITARVPLRRSGRDCRYFQDKYEGMPVAGYSKMFNNMVEEIGRPRVHCCVGRWCAFPYKYDLIVFTGCMDEFYDLEYGRLPYRAIRFETEKGPPTLPAPVVNYCTGAVPYTRKADYCQFYSQGKEPKVGDSTIKSVEYPEQWNPDGHLAPSYPMRWFPEAEHQFSQYMGIQPPDNAVLCGRLGSYKYMNLDVTIADTMARLEKKLGEPLYHAC